MPNKARLDKEAREIVWRVSEYFRKQLNSNTADYVEKTVSACGVSRATVYRIRKEKEEPIAGRNRNKKPVTVYDEERYLIRKALYEFQQEEGCPPTLEQLRVRLQSSMDFDGDERMLRKMLRRQGFFLKKIEQPIKQEPESCAEEQNQDEMMNQDNQMDHNEVMQTKEEERLYDPEQLESKVDEPIVQIKTPPVVQTVTVAKAKVERSPQRIQVTPIARLTQSAQKVLVKQSPVANQTSLLNRRSLIGQKGLNPAALINQKAAMNQKAQMYQIVGVGRGGQVILKPQGGQQMRVVQKGTTILKVNQQRLQQQG